MDHNHLLLANTLAESFNALADEVQILTDRKTVLEHKLRFAHEQFQYLADKYAPARPEVAETLAKLQLPPHTSVDNSQPVPLPHRSLPHSQHRIAVVIRDGRRMASQLASMGDFSKTTASSRETLSRTSPYQTSMSTALEQDFTVEGTKGNLQCPFSAVDGGHDLQVSLSDQTPHHSADPICAAMYEEATSQPAPNASSAASKCPIRFMDKHSPEEIAHYVEAHKHELPRSHEVCLRMYQRNEEQVKKLDSKYDNIVSMIVGLGQLHQPMLQEADVEKNGGDSTVLRRHSQADEASKQRVEDWADAVTGSAENRAVDETRGDDDGRGNFFDRPLREIRVGESPSRPWGISVPVYEGPGHETQPPPSPPAAPVQNQSFGRQEETQPIPSSKGTGCPFGAHAKGTASSGTGMHTSKSVRQAHEGTHKTGKMPLSPLPPSQQSPPPLQQQQQQQEQHAFSTSEPVFIRPELLRKSTGDSPQMVFTGPVFIGYPLEEAVQFVKRSSEM